MQVLDSKLFQRPVVFFFNGIGDHILALPALRALSHLFAGRLRLMHGRGPFEFLLRELHLSAHVPVRMLQRPSGPQFHVRSTLDLVGTCDLFMVLVPWTSQALVEFKEGLGATATVGFGPGYGHRAPFDYLKHATHCAFEIPRLFNPDISLKTYCGPPRFSQSATRAATRLKTGFPGKKLLAIHADTGPEKMCDPDKLLAAIEMFLTENSEYRAVFVGLNFDGLNVDRFGSRAEIAKGLPLETAMCLVAQSDLFLGIDSCMLHVADFCRVRSVGIFGPTDPSRFGFLFAPATTIRSKPTMRDLPPSTILNALTAAAFERNKSFE